MRGTKRTNHQTTATGIRINNGLEGNFDTLNKTSEAIRDIEQDAGGTPMDRVELKLKLDEIERRKEDKEMDNWYENLL